MNNRSFADPWQLANRYFGEHNLAAAAQACSVILRNRPGDALANRMLSSIHIELGKPRLAAEYATRAAERAAGLPIADLLTVTWVLIVTGEARLARDLLLQIDPGDPRSRPGFWGAARQLGLLELHEPALRLLDAITEPAMRNVSVTTLHGHLLSVVGRSAEAVASFEESIAMQPAAPLPHLMLSRMSLDEGRAGRIDRLRRLLRDPPRDLDHLAMLQYALFGELDATGDTQEAWAALAAGALARSRLLPYDAAAENRIFDRLIDATPGGSVPSRQEQAVANATPIFIVGMPRTGTTLLERILGNHPDVRTCGELTALVQQHHWVADRVWSGMFDERAASEQARLDASLLGRRYLESVAWRTDGKRYFSDKTPGNFMAIALILRAMPHARIIHLHRDPMDACFSNLKVLFAPDVYPYSSSFEGLANHHRNYSRLMRHWDAVFPGRILNLAYEELVGDSERQAERILAYCGLQARVGVTDLTANRTSVSTESRSQVRQPIHQRNVGGWRRYATQLAPLEGLLQRQQ